ncbi:MAG: hypothetical protein PVF05_11615 [Gemmatimonadales bacterium]|jgi:predicted anti-sigma-YlaC factor YlaD
MLEAASTDLRPGADTDLARHLADCPGCRRLADRVLAGDATLDRMLRALAAESTPAVSGKPRARRRAIRRAAGFGAAAVAAAAAGVLLAPRGVRMNLTWSPAADRLAPAADVQVASNATTIFTTPDHAVTVVWLERETADRESKPAPSKEIE